MKPELLHTTPIAWHRDTPLDGGRYHHGYHVVTTDDGGFAVAILHREAGATDIHVALCDHGHQALYIAALLNMDLQQ